MNLIAKLFSALLFINASVATAQAFDHSHAALTTLLKKHVIVIDGGKNSQVDYVELKKERAALESYLASLSAVKKAEFNGWNKAQQMAFLINAYNGFTLDLIVQHYPVKSIKDIGGVFENRWKKKFFKLFGEDSYLDKIEHETLRKVGVYNEPRIHFAVNCASIGCPSLREEAFTAEKLDKQLDEQAVRFLSDRTRNRFANGKLELSMIFKWFREDFESGYKGFDGKGTPAKSREEYFAQYAKQLTDAPADQQLIANGKVPLAFIDYDWSLNGKK